MVTLIRHGVQASFNNNNARNISAVLGDIIFYLNIAFLFFSFYFHYHILLQLHVHHQHHIYITLWLPPWFFLLGIYLLCDIIVFWLSVVISLVWFYCLVFFLLLLSLTITFCMSVFLCKIFFLRMHPPFLILICAL